MATPLIGKKIKSFFWLGQKADNKSPSIMMSFFDSGTILREVKYYKILESDSARQRYSQQLKMDFSGYLGSQLGDQNAITYSPKLFALNIAIKSILSPIVPLTYLLDSLNFKVQKKVVSLKPAKNVAQGFKNFLAKFGAGLLGSVRLLWWVAVEPVGKLVVKAFDSMVYCVNMAQIKDKTRLQKAGYVLGAVASAIGTVLAAMLAWTAIILPPVAAVWSGVMHMLHPVSNVLAQVFNAVTKPIGNVMRPFMKTVSSFFKSKGISTTQSKAFATSAAAVVTAAVVDAPVKVFELREMVKDKAKQGVGSGEGASYAHSLYDPSSASSASSTSSVASDVAPGS